MRNVIFSVNRKNSCKQPRSKRVALSLPKRPLEDLIQSQSFLLDSYTSKQQRKLFNSYFEGLVTSYLDLLEKSYNNKQPRENTSKIIKNLKPTRELSSVPHQQPFLAMVCCGWSDFLKPTSWDFLSIFLSATPTSQAVGYF